MENNNLTSTTVLIDTFTKEAVDSISYDMLSQHATIVTDIRELSDAHFKNDVVIFEPSLLFMVTPEYLIEFKDKYQINPIIVYQKEDSFIPFKGIATGIRADYSNLDWNFIYACVQEDLAILEPYQKSVKLINAYDKFTSKFTPDTQAYLEKFRNSYLALTARVQDVLKENSDLRDTLTIQETIGKQTVEGILELKDLLDRTQDKCNGYEALLSKQYDKTFTGFYPERPRICYIKKVSHVAGIDIFLSVLFAVLTKQYKYSCKIVKLVDSSNALDLRYVPNNYVSVTDPYNTSELLTNDFILKLGAYNIMFDTLLLNRSKLDFLIVHDMRGSLTSALDQSLIDLRINEVSADYADMGEYVNVLSNLGKQVAFPWSFRECQKYTGTRVTRLANHPTITAVLDLLL